MTTTPPTVPLHAAFLLLAHDPATGRCLVDDTHLKPALAGAGLLELTRTGSLRLEAGAPDPPPGHRWSRPRGARRVGGAR